MTRRILMAALIVALALGTYGCASAKETAKTMVQQGVETTSTGPHNVAPANNAQGAVDALNGATQQSQQGVDENTGQ